MKSFFAPVRWLLLGVPAFAVPFVLATAQVSPAPGIPIGWCTLPREEALLEAKKAGFDYVELALQEILAMDDLGFETFRSQLEASGIKVLAGYNPLPRDVPVVGPSANPEKQDLHLEHLLRRAVALKLTYLVFNSGAAWRIPVDFSVKVAGVQLLDFSKRFATRAAASGITVLVEPVRSTDSNQLTSVASALKLVELVGQASFQLVVDYSSLVAQKEAPSALAQAGEHLRLVHFANPSPSGRAFPLAASESGYAAFFQVLHQIGFRGGISIRAGTESFVTEAPRAIAFLREQTAAVIQP